MLLAAVRLSNVQKRVLRLSQSYRSIGAHENHVLGAVALPSLGKDREGLDIEDRTLCQRSSVAWLKDWCFV
jgi:hypothetical protein